MKRSSPRPLFEVCVLAGGLSMRMGRDKARLLLDGRSMLGRIRAVAKDFLAGDSSPSRVRVIRKDHVRRCGPLGGIVTALRTTKAQAVLFLACDMPLVSPALLKRIVRASRGGNRAVFVSQRACVGFPCVVPREALALVEQQIASAEFSLHALAKTLGARRLKVSDRSGELLNVNTPKDVSEAEQVLSHTR